MSDTKQQFIQVRMPSFTRLLIGALMAYWLSTIMNPAFVAIAVLVFLLIPILTVDNIFSEQFSRAYRQPPPVQPKVISKSEYLETKSPVAEKKSEPPAPEPAKNAKSKSKSKAKSKK